MVAKKADSDAGSGGLMEMLREALARVSRVEAAIRGEGPPPPAPPKDFGPELGEAERRQLGRQVRDEHDRMLSRQDAANAKSAKAHLDGADANRRAIEAASELSSAAYEYTSGAGSWMGRDAAWRRLWSGKLRELAEGFISLVKTEAGSVHQQRRSVMLPPLLPLIVDGKISQAALDASVGATLDPFSKDLTRPRLVNNEASVSARIAGLRRLVESIQEWVEKGEVCTEQEIEQRFRKEYDTLPQVGGPAGEAA